VAEFIFIRHQLCPASSDTLGLVTGHIERVVKNFEKGKKLKLKEVFKE
jgi:hypothetical protein